MNYDETNISNDPGRKKVIFKRGTKYPERIINSSKTSTSVMYAGCADGTILPPYVVYKATHMYNTWTTGSPGAEGGPVCKICPLILTLDPYWGP